MTIATPGAVYHQGNDYELENIFPYNITLPRDPIEYRHIEDLLPVKYIQELIFK